jgi:hypothetical protein
MEQSGHINVPFVRHLLSDPSEESVRRSSPSAAEHGEDWYRRLPEHGDSGGTACFVVSLSRNSARLPMAWCTFGTPQTSLYFPVFLDGELPALFTDAARSPTAEDPWPRLCRLGERLEREPERCALVRESFARLQARFDQEAEEFNAEGAALKQRNALSDLHRQATLFMQYNFERFEEVVADSLRARLLLAGNS